PSRPIHIYAHQQCNLLFIPRDSTRGLLIPFIQRAIQGGNLLAHRYQIRYLLGNNMYVFVFFFQAEDGIRDRNVTGVQTCALPIYKSFVDQTPEAAVEWGRSIGESTLSVVQCMLDTSQTEKQALQSIFSLKKTERRYTKYEIERACKMVVSMTQRPTVKSIQTILKNNKKNDAEQEMKRKTENSENNYGFTRGASYYGGADNNE